MKAENGSRAPEGAFTPELAERPTSSDPDSLRLRIQRLAEPVHRGGRYSKEMAIGSGGMGIVHRVRDLELDRTLALKEMKLETSKCGPLHAARFLEEAQVTAQLDHPGIVPVHEVGVNDEGRLYFAMKLVRGRVLQTILDLLERKEEGWNLPRLLTVLLKVCEAMAYSHSKGVLHRDLKPANIMVGNFGEVYVMDWGLARILGRPDLHDLRIDQATYTASLHTVRRPEIESDDPSPLLTMDGEIVGTPSYMAPEQARGDLERISPRSDVYSIGAILYHALTGQAPFVPPDAKIAAQSVLWRLIEGPPTPVAQLRPSIPAELVAICEKAMAREPERRYPDMGALAEDLSAFLEQRVVVAYETGAWAEARKWIRRNKQLAATLAAAVLLLLGGLGGVGYVEAAGRKVAEHESERADTKAREAEQNLALSRRNAELAQEERRRAEEETAKVLRLADDKRFQDLEAEADALWPAHPETIPALESWLARARSLVGNLDVHRATLAQMRTGAVPWSEEEQRRDRLALAAAEELPGKQATFSDLMSRLEDGSNPRASGKEVEERLEKLQEEIARLRADVASRPTWRFASLEDEWQHDFLLRLIDDLEKLPTNLLAEDVITADHGWSIPKRLAFAKEMAAGFGPGGMYARAWAEALPDIRWAYQGLELTPQIGLLPLGPDPATGLWEFAHLQTGKPAVRGPEGKLQISSENGLVFVLLPGGTFHRGAQKVDPSGPNYDPGALDNEAPVSEVTLTPFFFSKYEMNQAQWLLSEGQNPGAYRMISSTPSPLLNPIQQVSWNACSEVCRRLGLSLPSEAQWEYGARGGTTTPWWTGSERDSLRGAVNMADQAAARMGGDWPSDWPELDDGFGGYAPVDQFEPNPFGLHNVHGNVWEWCFDATRGYSPDPARDPVVDPVLSQMRIIRGGAFNSPASNTRCALRRTFTAEYAGLEAGLRPVRTIHP